MVVYEKKLNFESLHIYNIVKGPKTQRTDTRRECVFPNFHDRIRDGIGPIRFFHVDIATVESCPFSLLRFVWRSFVVRNKAMIFFF